MKMTVSFSEMNEALSAEFEESEQTFALNFGEYTVLHDGQNGATFFPTVSDDGILSWTNNRGLENPAPVRIKGDDGTKFTVDKTLTLADGILSVNTAEEVEKDNTLPVTSAAVHTTVGNINALLATI